MLKSHSNSEENYIQNNALPDHWFRRITDIHPETLREMGVEAVTVDLDNTTVADTSFHLPKQVRQWIQKIQEAGIRVAIVSNTVTLRAWILAKKMGGVPFVGLSKKPDPDCMFRIAEKLQLPLSKIAMIGDQLFTDILVANRVGAVSIKVEPMGKDIFNPKRYARVREQEKEYLRRHNLCAETLYAE